MMGILRKTVSAAGIGLLAAVFCSFLWAVFKHASTDVKLALAYAGIISAAAAYLCLARRFRWGDAVVLPSVFLLSFLIQASFSLNVVLPGEGDLQFYFSNASKLAGDGFSLPSLYAATFPGTVTYPTVLALFMKVLGVHRLVPVFLNHAAVSAAVAAVFLFMKTKVPREWALGCALLMALHPYVIIYADTCNAELLYGCCALFSWMAFDRALNAARKQYVWFAVSAFFCGLASLFRPLSIVLAAACILCLLLFHAGKLLPKLTAAAILCAGLACFSLVNGLIVKQVTGYDAPSNSFGWNLYVGGSETGRWNQADGDEFNEVIQAASAPSEIQRYFSRKAFDRYRNMGFRVIPHGLKKVRYLNSIDYMAEEAVTQGDGTRFNTGQSRGAYTVLIAAFDLPVFLAGLAGCALALFRPPKNGMAMAAMALYMTGTFAALTLLEIAPRYTVSHHITLCIPAVWMAYELFHRLILSRRKKSAQ